MPEENDHTLLAEIKTDIRWMREAQTTLFQKVDDVLIRMDRQVEHCGTARKSLAEKVSALEQSQAISKAKLGALIAILVAIGQLAAGFIKAHVLGGP